MRIDGYGRIDRSREIGAAGADLIAAPRCTGPHRRWPVAAAMAAVIRGFLDALQVKSCLVFGHHAGSDDEESTAAEGE